MYPISVDKCDFRDGILKVWIEVRRANPTEGGPRVALT
jgi:hypothetical protein